MLQVIEEGYVNCLSILWSLLTDQHGKVKVFLEIVKYIVSLLIVVRGELGRWKLVLYFVLFPTL